MIDLSFRNLLFIAITAILSAHLFSKFRSHFVIHFSDDTNKTV